MKALCHIILIYDIDFLIPPTVWDVTTNFTIATLLHNTAYLANEKPLNFQFGQVTFVGYFDLLVQDIVRLENTLQLVKIRTPLL